VNHYRLTIKGLPAEKHYYLVVGATPQKVQAGKNWAAGTTVYSVSSLNRNSDIFRTVAEKNALFFNRHRPQNETYLFLFRKHEIPQFDPLIAEKEKEIAELRKPVVHKFELKLVE
jgi:hypothetical protein